MTDQRSDVPRTDGEGRAGSSVGTGVAPRGDAGDGPTEGRPHRTYFGRNGSPEITVAFPFARVEVTRADEALRAATVAALTALDALAEQVLVLTQPHVTAAQRNAVGAEIEALRTELEQVLQATAMPAGG